MLGLMLHVPILNAHVYSPTRQKDRQRQIIYSGIKHIVNNNNNNNNHDNVYGAVIMTGPGKFAALREFTRFI